MVESTRAVIIDFEAANCGGASALKSGKPRAPLTIVEMTSQRTSFLQRDEPFMLMVLHNFGRGKKYLLKNFGKIGNSIDDQCAGEEWLIIY